MRKKDPAITAHVEEKCSVGIVEAASKVAYPVYKRIQLTGKF